MTWLKWCAGAMIITVLFIPTTLIADSYSYFPAYSEHISGSTSLTNMQTFAMQSAFKTRVIGEDGTPSGVEYMLSITPVNGSPAAIGTVSTTFAGLILEGRGTRGKISSRNEWKDSTTVSGSIVKFLKNFDYTSGIRV